LRRSHNSAAVGLAAFAGLLGCSDPPSTGTVTVRLTDAPFPFDAIAAATLDVRGVEVHLTADDPSHSGFHVVTGASAVVNLLDLSNGVTALVGEAEVPVGRVGQMRLLVASASVALTDGRTFDLDMPSGESSGLKIFFEPPIAITTDEPTDLLVDVDVSRSFRPEPSAATRVDEITGFRFHPVLRAAVVSETGALTGRVTANADGSPIAGATVSLLQGADAVTSTATDANGDWTILGVAPHDWIVRAEASGHTPAQTSAEVTAGATATVEGLALD
jgi:hypothetical protein